MSEPRILAIIQAGGSGGRMDVLTRERAKPALPFAGVYQLVDFPLSNLAHSGISEVWLSLQYQGATLEDSVANGRPWDLDRTRGGLRLLMPQQGTGSDDEEGFARGNADELYRIRDQIRSADPEVVVVLSADHVYRFDYLEAVATHREKQAECTIVTTEVDLDEAGEHATVESDENGRVTGFAYKPEEPTTGTVATEIFVYDARALVAVVEELHRERSGQAEGGDSGLGDSGESLRPRFVERGRARRLRGGPRAAVRGPGPDRRARPARVLARPGPAAPLPGCAPGHPGRRPPALPRPGRADPAPPAAARACSGLRRRRGRGQSRLARS